MGENGEATCSLSVPVQVEKVSIRRAYAFPLGIGRTAHPPHEGGQNGLQVPRKEEAGVAIAGWFDERHVSGNGNSILGGPHLTFKKWLSPCPAGSRQIRLVSSLSWYHILELMPQNTPAASEVRQYWRANILVVSVLLVIWFVVSFLLSIVWADWLNQFRWGGFPLGFWISQQGAIFVFILLILAYAIIMGRLDRQYHAGEKR